MICIIHNKFHSYMYPIFTNMHCCTHFFKKTSNWTFLGTLHEVNESLLVDDA